MFCHLCFSANYIEANTIKGMLENAGIPVHLVGEALSGAMGELPANVTQVEVLVDAQKLDKAEVLLDEYQYASRSTQPHWLCKQCGEDNAPQFEICWQCGGESEL